MFIWHHIWKKLLFEPNLELEFLLKLFEISYMTAGLDRRNGKRWNRRKSERKIPSGKDRYKEVSLDWRSVSFCVLESNLQKLQAWDIDVIFNQLVDVAC